MTVEQSSARELQPPNLARLNQAIRTYSEVVPNVVSRGYLDEILAPLNLKSTLLISFNGSVSQEVIGNFINFITKEMEPREKEEADIFPPYQPSGRDFTATTDAEAKFQKQLLGFKTIATVQRFVLNHIWNKVDKPGNEQLKDFFNRLTDTNNQYQAEAADSLIIFGNNLLAHDAALAGGLPYAATGGALADFMGKLAIATANHTLVRAYEGLIRPVEQQSRLLRNTQNDPWYTPLVSFAKPRDPREVIIKIRQNFRDEDWQALNATPDQIRRFYDVTSEQFFLDLHMGRYESWEGTAVAHIFSILHDPRAIPRLIRHLELFGSGHTNAIVADVIREILKNPLSKEELEATIKNASNLHQRIIEEWFIHPNNWVNQFDGYGIAAIIKNAEKYFALGELANAAKNLAEQKGVEIEDKVLQSFFMGNFGDWFGTQQVEKLLTENLEGIAPILIKHKLLDKEHLPLLFNAMINPSDQNYFHYPRMFIQEAFGLDDDVLAKLGKLYETADLKRSVFARATLIADILWLSSKEAGKEILKTVLAASTGASRDPERIRQIFRGLHILDSLGSFDFSPKPTLNEILEDLRQKHIHTIKQKMNLSNEEVPFLEKRLAYLIETNVVEIIPTLLAQHAGKAEVSRVIREIGRHIVLGDFKQWRNGLETAQKQLSVIAEDKQVAWLKPFEVRITMEAQSDKAARKTAAEAIKRIVFEAQAHIQEVYKLEFSQHRLDHLHKMQEQLIQEIKRGKNSDEKRELSVRKSSIDNEVRIIEGIVSLAALDEENVDPRAILEMIAKTKNAMERFQGLEQPAADLDQIEKVLTTQQKLTTAAQLRAYDSDDPSVLLKAGTEPRETCQSWRRGSYNYCLPAYVVDVNKRVFNVESEHGEVIARSVAKLTHIKTQDGQRIPAILLEPIYTTAETTYIYRAIARLALAKAQATSTVLILTAEMIAASHADQSKTIEVLPQEAKKAGFTIDKKPVEVFIPQSYHAYEYSDTLGGAINFFERYQPLQKAMIVSKL